MWLDTTGESVYRKAQSSVQRVIVGDPGIGTEQGPQILALRMWRLLQGPGVVFMPRYLLREADSLARDSPSQDADGSGLVPGVRNRKVYS